jgi:hypothetical protein
MEETFLLWWTQRVDLAASKEKISTDAKVMTVHG